MTSAPSSTVDACQDAGCTDRSAPALGRSVGLVYRSFRRTVDVTVSFVGLVVSLPLFLVVAASIAASSRGPVFFSQDRIGLGGERFTIVKFRTMRQGTDQEVLSDPAVYEAYVANGYKLGNDDPRITRIGRWLRKTSLDELPQMVNVLAGQMSIVGVRPLVPDEFAARAPSDRELYVRLRPGLTGLWQIAGRSSLSHANRLELDREYLRTASIRRDLSILLRTPAALFRTGEAH